MTAAGAAGVGAFELVVLGAGPAYTDRPDSSGAAYLIRHRDGAILLDLGQGSFPRLASELEPSTLSAILVSHLHPDHFVDLVPLRHYLRWHLSPSRRVRVIGPAGLGQRLDGLHAEPGFSAGALDIEALTEGSAVIAPFTVEAGLVDSYRRELWVPRLASARDPDWSTRETVAVPKISMHSSGPATCC